MKYLEKEDLISVIQERLLDESVANVANDDAIIDDVESKAIDYAISYIAGRYNTDLIFADPVKRNGVLVQTIAQIVVYRSVRRNAARKVPEDLMETYKDAIKTLERIQSGAMLLVGLPVLTAVDGTTNTPYYGNSKNTDYFI